MESPVDSTVSGSISQFGVREGQHHSRHASSSVISNSAAVSPSSISGRLFGISSDEQQPGSSSASVGHLSSDEILDLSETTRKAVSAMLSMPLEGADVAGVSGWLGEGYTPMEMLNEDEVKETLATTSHIVVREREQQLRRQQQEMRHLMHRQQLQSIVTRQGSAAIVAAAVGTDVPATVYPLSAASDSRVVMLSSASEGGLVSAEFVGPQSDSAVVSLAARRSLFNKRGDDDEPPALYPLPSDEEDI
ncbi:hypothetical protein IWW38_005693 [Coemansia aciculifera]|uniref:Uncharacterized protein n=1 Tax=Coemansia aciculifera TaxID=417176 RepID=A0ACC1LUS8_9FUNG|nr:hypothetical protein IWW38_005693 [Coemansia aciculifera]